VSAEFSSLNVIVLAGGPSREREISLRSGNEVAKALTAAGHTVRVCDITPNDLSALKQSADVFFVAMHGAFGEDGELQELLENSNVAYTGSPSRACRLSADKFASKTMFAEHGIPTALFDLVRSPADVMKARACWTMPVVIKPIEEGSSIGVSIVRHADDLVESLEDTLERFGPTLIEQFLPGKELTVGILGRKALPIIEIKVTGEFYDYEAKYNRNDTQYLFDTGLSEAMAKQISDWSLQAADVLGMRDFCRVDWKLDGEGNPFLLEINAIPGLTDHSLLPKAAARVGIDMPTLCHTVVQMACTRAGSSVR